MGGWNRRVFPLALAALAATGCGSALPKELAASELGCSVKEVEVISTSSSSTKRASGCGRTLYYRAYCDDVCSWQSGLPELTHAASAALKCDTGMLAWATINNRMSSVEGCGKRAFFYRSGKDGPDTWQLQRVEEHAPTAGKAQVGLTAAEIYERAVPSLVSIEAGSTQATAFAVLDGRVLITNLHAVAGESELKLTAHSGERLQFLGVLAFDRKWDLAVLQIDRALPALPLQNSDALTSGVKVFALGNPLGFEATISDGILSGVREHMAGMRVLQITAPISPGSSGGPILADDGTVVGVATFVMRGGENLGFAMPTRYVRELLGKRQHLSPQAFAAATADSAPSQRDLFADNLYARCSAADLTLLNTVLGSTTKALEPLIVQASFKAGLAVFRGAAEELERNLTRACSAPPRQLHHGERQAEALFSDRVKLLALQDLLASMLRQTQEQMHENQKIRAGKTQP
ncbi:MAG: S1C family serine protease [Polyangiaceae bacterium]|nr:S1C family serine protease [Polyangiaceae bacterium]